MDYVPNIDIMLKISKLGYYQSNINLYRYNPYSTLYNIVLWLKYYHHIFIWIKPVIEKGDKFQDVRYVAVVYSLDDFKERICGGYNDEIPALEDSIKCALDLIENEKGES